MQGCEIPSNELCYVFKLLHDFGMKGSSVRAFEQSLIDRSSRDVVIDGHIIGLCSNENYLLELGYNMGLLKASQMDLLMAYDINYVLFMYRI